MVRISRIGIVHESTHLAKHLSAPKVRDVLGLRVPTKLWGLGRSLIEMAALASLVPIASDIVVTGVFTSYSLLVAYRIVRRKDAAPARENPESETAARTLRLLDRIDASSNFLEDLGYVAPLSVPFLWFALSVPAYLAAGQFLSASVLGAAAALTCIPILGAVRSGVRKTMQWWRGRADLADSDTMSSGVIN